MESKEEKQLLGTRLPESEGGVRRFIERRLPILSWSRLYTGGDALADLVAGLTLGLTLVPQSIAYASLARVPLHYGLYTSFMGSMLYVVLGTVKEVSIGPTSLMALLTAQICGHLTLEYVPLLTFLSGAMVLLMGLMRLGFLVDFISSSVTLGFTSGTAAMIVASQMKGLLGGKGGGDVWRGAGRAVIDLVSGRARVGDAVLSAGCCTVLLVLRKLKDIPVGPKRRHLALALWLLSISRNALVVVCASLVAYFTVRGDGGHPYFTLSGKVAPGLPSISLPRFSLPPSNTTAAVSFPKMAEELGSGLLYVPIVMVLANIAIAKAFSPGGVVDATQEMLTLGLCNLAGSVLGALPACGAFTRSAVSHSSGVRTPLQGLYSGIITLLATAFMTPYFYYIPKACLSSVLICAVIFMIDFQGLLKVYKESKWEFFVAMVSIAGVVWSPAGGLALGVGVALVPAAQNLLRPKLTPLVLHSTPYCVHAQVTSLLYLSAPNVCANLLEAVGRVKATVLLVDCSSLTMIDYNGVKELKNLDTKLKKNNQKLVVYNANDFAHTRLSKVKDLDLNAINATNHSEALSLAGVQDPLEIKVTS